MAQSSKARILEHFQFAPARGRSLTVGLLMKVF
jgi:hypothetical protein